MVLPGVGRIGAERVLAAVAEVGDATTGPLPASSEPV